MIDLYEEIGEKEGEGIVIVVCWGGGRERIYKRKIIVLCKDWKGECRLVGKKEGDNEMRGGGKLRRRVGSFGREEKRD